MRGYQRSNLKIYVTFLVIPFFETSRGLYVGFMLALGVSDLKRSLEVTNNGVVPCRRSEAGGVKRAA